MDLRQQDPQDQERYRGPIADDAALPGAEAGSEHDYQLAVSSLNAALWHGLPVLGFALLSAEACRGVSLAG